MPEGAPRESISERAASPIEYQVVTTLEGRQAAHALSDRVYEREGLKPPKTNVEDKHYPFEKWIMAPLTRVFTVSIAGEPVGTIALVKDSEIGLPMDELYKETLDEFREQGDRLCEVSQFAVDTEAIEQAVTTGRISARDLPEQQLLKIVLHYAMHESIDRLFIVCRPSHANFYRSMGLVQIGEEKYYAKVNNIAVPLMLDISSLEERDNLPRRLREVMQAPVEKELIN